LVATGEKINCTETKHLRQSSVPSDNCRRQTELRLSMTRKGTSARLPPFWKIARRQLLREPPTGSAHVHATTEITWTIDHQHQPSAVKAVVLSRVVVTSAVFLLGDTIDINVVLFFAAFHLTACRSYSCQ